MSHLDVREKSSREQQPEPARFVPPASPEGQRWLASAIGNRAFSEAVVARSPLGQGVLARKRPDVAFEDETVHGDSWFDGVESRMFDVETRLGANAANYGVLVLQACEHFGALADGRVENIAGEITGEQFAEALVGAALAVVVGQLTSQIASAAFKSVASQAGRQVTDRIRKEAKGAASNKDDVDALKAAIVAIKLKVLDAGTRMTSEAQAWLPKQLKPIYSKCRAREELDDGEFELVEPFIDLPADLIDGQIERMYGIPSAASAKVVQIEVYRGLVEEFARVELTTTTKGVRESIELGFGKGAQSLGGQARAAAQAAAGVRADALEATWQDFAKAGRSYEEAAACGVPLPARDEYDRARG